MRQSFLLLTLFFTLHLSAQTLPYVFSVEQGVYTPLTNATSVNNGVVWDDPSFQVPLGFSFQLFGQSTPTLNWYGEFEITVFGLPGNINTPFLISYGADLIDRGYDTDISQSPISYKVEGTPGNRIFKMQWSNAGFFYDGTGTDFTNLQMWLYEGSNDVELRFGPTQVADNSIFDFTGPIIGFMDNFSFQTETSDNMWYLAGPVNNPKVKLISGQDGDTLHQTLNGAPGDGLIYRFSTNLVDVSDPQQWSGLVRVYPSLVGTTCTIEVPEELAGNEADTQFALFDQLGREVRRAPLTGKATQLDMSDLPAGLYFVHLFSAGRVIATKKLVKQ